MAYKVTTHQTQLIANILEEEKNRYKLIKDKHSDKKDGRCAIGVLLSHFGWDGCTTIGWIERDKTEKLFRYLDMPFSSGADFGWLSKISDDKDNWDDIISGVRDYGLALSGSPSETFHTG
jgi:hypothetical protein